MNLKNYIQDQVIPTITARLETNINAFGDYYPEYGVGDSYLLTANDHWMTSFWTGLLWLAYNGTKNENFAHHAQSHLSSFEKRLVQRVDISHDLGFLYTLSSRAQWQLKDDIKAYNLTLRAATMLLERYRPTGQYIQAWGEIGDEARGGGFIVDCLMNLPLLFWAGQELDDPRFAEAAIKHANTSLRYLVRSDWRTIHTFYLDQESGEPIGAKKHQGFADDSVWSRGQAWSIYGFALAAEWSGYKNFQHTAEQSAHYFMSQLPPNGLPLWDFELPDGAPRFPDSSAGAIAAGGMLRLARMHENQEQQAVFWGYAEKLLAALLETSLEDNPNAHGLLRNGAYSVNENKGVDTYTIFGDYFFVEALFDFIDQAPDFWGIPK